MPREIRERPDADAAAGSPTPSAETQRSRGRWVFTVAVAAACVVAGATIAIVTTRPAARHAVPTPTPAPEPEVASYLVALGAHGNCAASPCGSIDAAVARAKKDHADGAVIQIAAGSYPAQTISEAKAKADASVSVVVKPAPGAQVSLGSLTMDASHVTISGVTITGPAKVETNAVASGFDNITTEGGSVYLAASGSFLNNSRVKPAVDGDGVQIKAYDGKNPDGVTIEHTVVGPTHRGPKRSHVDCVQILAGSNIVIRYDKLFHCADQGIIAGSGAGGHITGPIDVERTEVQLCPQRTDDCDGYDVIDMRAPKVTFVHNTVIDGGVVFEVADLTVAANYLDNLKSCGGTLSGNLIASTKCALPTGNREGRLRFADVDAAPPNLTPMNPVVLPDSAHWVGGRFSATDVSGRRVDPAAATVGAVQAGGGS